MSGGRAAYEREKADKAKAEALECTFRPRTTRPPAYLTKSSDGGVRGGSGGGGGGGGVTSREQRYSERMMAIAAERQRLWH